MRIIGGVFRGRLLHAPKGDQTRPSSSLVRKALFDICKNEIVDAEFLDLFAGSGAMGIEAISRGAKFCTFVDKSPLACRTIKQNIESLSIKDQTEVFCSPIERALETFKRKHRRFSLIFLDPPYGKDLLPPILDKIVEFQLLAPLGKLFAEESVKTPIPQSTSLQFIAKRTYGDSILLEYTPFE
jgi:16S rRNA (guanine966-N2)-methyltransferase